MKKNVDMINGKLLSNMILFAFPVLMTGVLQTLYSSADAFIVGRYDSALALGAVGSSTSTINMIIGLFIGIALGTNVLVARYFGAGNMEKVKKATYTGFIISIVSGIAAMIAGLFLADPVARMLKLDADIIDMAILYMKIYFLGIPFMSMYNFLSSALRGIGDSKNPMYCSVSMGALNVILNIVFVKYMSMGVAGVAIATVISQAFSVVLVLIILAKSEIGFRLKEISFDKKICVDTIKIGLPSGLQGTIFSFSNTINISGVNYFGAAAATGNSVALQVEGLLYAALNSITVSVVPFVSQNIGAKKPEKINKILFTGWGLAITVGLVLSTLSYLLKYQLVDIFTSSEEPALKAEIIKYAVTKFRWTILTYFLVGFMEIPGGVLRGMGKTFMSMLMSVVGVCCFRITWQLLVFPLFLTPDVLFMAYPISWIATGMAYTVAYIIVKKKFDKKYLSA